MIQGIVYTVWGKYNKAHLNRSIESHDYNYTVIQCDNDLPGLSKKIEMYYQTPYDVTCYLDTDTQVFESLQYGFDMAEKYGIACCIAPAGSAYMAQPNSYQHLMPVDLPQYNTGVIFFRHDMINVFERWQELCHQYPCTGLNDQPAFSLALYEMDVNPYVLPREWNYRKKIRYEGLPHGPVKILHQK